MIRILQGLENCYSHISCGNSFRIAPKENGDLEFIISKEFFFRSYKGSFSFFWYSLKFYKSISEICEYNFVAAFFQLWTFFPLPCFHPVLV